MFESVLNPQPDLTDLRQQRRFVGWLLLALIVSSLVSIASLASDVTSYERRTDPSGPTTTRITHHTVTSRVVLSVVVVCQVVLVVGLFRRSHVAWRAAFLFPAVQALVVGVVGWPQLYQASPDPTVAIPLL